MDGNPSTQFPGDMPSAPPPPPEVKVRTMRSDLDAMAKSGGGAPHFETVTVTGLALGKIRPAETTTHPAQADESREGSKGRNTAIMIVVIVAAVAAIGALVYLAYRIFFVGTGIPSAQTNASPNATSTAAAPAETSSTATAPSSSAPASASVPTVPAAGPFIHATLFKKPADQTLILTLSSGGAATTAQDLETFSQKLSGLLAGAQANAHMIEIAIKGSDGNGVAAGDVLTQANASFLSAAALADFSPDATFFAYQDKNGFWPGIVLSLKPGDNWLFAKSDVQPLESSSAIENLFLDNVGAPAVGGFVDSTVSSTAVRSLSFPAATSPATFLYGWYQSYLIISTSRSGFAAAMNLL